MDCISDQKHTVNKITAVYFLEQESPWIQKLLRKKYYWCVFWGFWVAYQEKQEKWPKYTALKSKEARWFAACKHYTEQLICLQSITTPNSVKCARCCLCSCSVQTTTLLMPRYCHIQHRNTLHQMSTVYTRKKSQNTATSLESAKWETLIPWSPNVSQQWDQNSINVHSQKQPSNPFQSPRSTPKKTLHK